MNTDPAAMEGASGPVAVQADRGGTDMVPALLDGLRGTNPAWSCCSARRRTTWPRCSPGWPPTCRPIA